MEADPMKRCSPCGATLTFWDSVECLSCSQPFCERCAPRDFADELFADERECLGCAEYLGTVGGIVSAWRLASRRAA